ncbi:MAG: hypothetical protein ACX94C_09935 [Phycisphaerales bacterium]
MKTTIIGALALTALPALAGTSNDILVEIRGDVFGNQVSTGAFGNVMAGETVTYSFELNSSSFVDGSFPVRGYTIDTSTFSMDFSGGTSVGVADPYPAGFQPLFVLRNDDPAVDGFFITDGSVDGFPNGIATDQAGVFGNFSGAFSVTYNNDPLSSLDILDAAGDYDFTGLTVFGMGINDGPIEGVVGIDFNSMTISVIPAPSGIALVGLGGLVASRRRR